MGKIGMAVSPANPDVIYAVIEAQRDEGGTYKSTDRGETWKKVSDYVAGSPQYYNELVADPVDVDTVYSMDTWLHRTVDGGVTWTKVGEDNKHVDNHAMWINPADTDHFVVGCDGGVYLSYDRGATWKFHRQPAHHPVLPGVGRQLQALLPCLRRHPGQQLPRRSAPHPR